MAASIEEDLQPVQQTRNEMVFKVSTDNYIDTAGVYGVTAFGFTGGVGDLPQAGDTISITDGGALPLSDLVLTAAATPDTSGLQFEEYSSGTAEDWIKNSLIPALEAHPTLNFYWSFEHVFNVHDGVKITAKNYGDQWEMGMNGTGFAMASIGAEVVPGVEEEAQANFSLAFELWVEEEYESGTFERVLVENLPIVQDIDAGVDYAIFRPNEVVHAYTQNEDLKFLAAPAQLENIVKRFYIRYGERYGDPATTQALSTSSTYIGIRAGLNFLDDVNNSSILDVIEGGPMFLTWWPNTTEEDAKHVLPEQKEALSFMFGASPSTVDVLADLHWSDGTVTTAHNLHTITDPDPYSVWQFNVGVEQKNLPNVEPTKTLNRYEVYIAEAGSGSGSGSSNALSETRHFKVLHDHFEFARFFFYANSFGCFDTVLMTGLQKRSIALDRNRYTRNLVANAQTRARATRTRSRGFRESFDQASGFFTKEEVHALDDFLNSEKVFVQEGIYFTAINLDKNKFKREEDDRGIYVNNFSFTKANTNKAYSSAE